MDDEENKNDSSKVDTEILSIIEEGFPEEGRLISIRPSSDKGGIKNSTNFFRNLYKVETEYLDFWNGKKNTSDVCGMEIWYQNEKIKFNFFVPNEKKEEKYRKHLNSQFEGSTETKMDIYERDESTGEFEQKEIEKFIEVNEGDFMTGSRFYLKHHFFEPVRSKKGVDKFGKDDPYKQIFSELDSKDGTRAVIQVLYRPADKDWTETPNKNVREHADKLKNKKITKSKLFGLVKREVEDPNKAPVKFIKRQEGSRAYHVNIRFIMVSDDKEQLDKDANNLNHIFKVTYEEDNGQTFDPRPAEDMEELKELLSDVVSRKGRTMQQLSGFRDSIRESMNSKPFLNYFVDDYINKNRMIMTIPELAGVSHMPSVDMGSIVWSDSEIGGTLPGNAERHKPLTDEEKLIMKTELKRSKKKFYNNIGDNNE
jgi:hypothetical protein